MSFGRTVDVDGALVSGAGEELGGVCDAFSLMDHHHDDSSDVEDQCLTDKMDDSKVIIHDDIGTAERAHFEAEDTVPAMLCVGISLFK